MEKIAVTEEEAHRLLRSAQDRVHDAGGGDAARDHRRRAGEGRRTGQAGVNVGLDEEAKAKAEALRAARAEGRGLRQARGRELRRAVEGQRRADRADQPDELSPARAEVIEGLKGRRVRAGAPREGLADHQARNADADRHAAARSGARSGVEQGVPREARRRARKVPEEAARAGDHRVEERRDQEGLRAGAGRGSQGAREPPVAATSKPGNWKRSRRRIADRRASDQQAASMKIGPLPIEPAFGVAPMAGMTDTAFRRLVKRHGGCGLVVTRDGQLRGARARHRSHARIRRVHRRRAAGLDSDLRRRSREDGRRRADRRRHGRQRRRHQHGMPGAEDRQAQRRLQPDARRRRTPPRSSRDGEGGEDSGHGEDARRLERRGDQRAAAREDGRGRRRVGDHRARPHRRAGLHRVVRLGPDRPRRRRRQHSGLRQRRLHRARARRRAPATPACRACSSAAACCAIRGFSRRPPISPPAVPAARRHDGGSRAVPARLHRSAAARARRRGARLPSRSADDAEEARRARAAGPRRDASAG